MIEQPLKNTENVIFRMAFQCLKNQQKQSDNQQPSIFAQIIYFIQSILDIHTLSFMNSCSIPKIKRIVDNINSELLEIVPQYQYGSMIIFQKNSKESYPNVYIVFPTQWKLSLSISNQKVNLYPQSNLKYSFLHISTIQDSVTSLKQMVSLILQQLDQIKSIILLNKNQDKKKNHHTPSWLSEALIESIKKWQMKKQKKQYEIQFKIQSKGGTLDVGQHTGITKPDTVYTCIWGVLWLISQDNQFIKALQINYKIHLLTRRVLQINSQTTQNTHKNRSQVSKCLKQYRQNLVELQYEQNPYYIKNKAFQMMKSIKNSPTKYKQRKKYKYKTLGKILPQQSLAFESNNYIPKLKAIQGLHYSVAPRQIFTIQKQTLFENLLSIRLKCQAQQWVNIVEDTVFKLTIIQLQNGFNFQSFDPKILNQSDNNILQLLEMYIIYMKSLLDKCHLRKLKCLLHSHIQLMKTISGIIAFQIFKNYAKNTVYNVSEYIPPIQFQQIIKNFNSLHYRAKRACQTVLIYYFENINKTKLFCLEDGYANYRIYATQVAEKSPIIQKAKKQQKSKIEKQVKKLRDKIRNHKVTENSHKAQLQSVQGMVCQCRQQEYQAQQNYGSRKYPKYRTVTKVRSIQCQKCTIESKYTALLKKHRKKRGNHILSSFPRDQSDMQVYLFFQKMPRNLVELLKIFMCIQIYQQGKINNENLKKLLTNGNLKILVKPAYSQGFSFAQVSENHAEKLIQYPQAQITIKWKQHDKAKRFYNSLYKIPEINDNLWNKKFSHILKDPLKNIKNVREHQIYSQFIFKPNINPQEYISASSIRVGILTQIPILLDDLNSRKIRINTTSQQQLYPLNIIWKSLSQLNSLACPFTQIEEQINQQVLEGVRTYISNFLDTYMNEWTNEDFLCLPALGPVLSLLYQIVAYEEQKQIEPIYMQQQSYLDSQQQSYLDSQQQSYLNSQQQSYLDSQQQSYLNSQQQSYLDSQQDTISVHPIFNEILDKILTRIKIIEEDNEAETQDQSKFSNNSLNQAFLCLGGLCCFSEPIIQSSDQIAVSFLKIYFIYQSKMNNIEHKSAEYHAIVNYQYLLRSAVQNNINNVGKYFQDNPQKITSVIRQIDQNIDQKTQWNYNPETNHYCFEGKNSFQSYQIDIKKGILLINGNNCNSLYKQFYQNYYYKMIFKNRILQVEKSSNKCEFRTRRNFRNLFSNSLAKQSKVLFSFGYSEQNKPIINMLIRSQNQQQRWTLLDKQQISTNLNLPYLYQQNYLPWICQQKQCIILRKPLLQNINQVGLAILYRQNVISKVHLISKQNTQSTLDQMCDINAHNFKKVLLRNSEGKNKIVLQVLKALQDEKYIIQLEEPSVLTRKFWLHRYDISFIQQEGKGLLPQNYQDYRISQFPHYHKDIPWQEALTNSIVLQKHAFNQLSVYQHDIKVMVPGHTILTRSYEKNANKKLMLYTYDLHDHLHRICGMSRQSQLYLAGTILRFAGDRKMAGINLNKIEYTVQILQSCFTNTPLSELEFKIITQIQTFAIQQESQTVILICHSIYLITQELLKLYKDQQNTALIQLIEKKCLDEKYRYYIAKCMDKYEQNVKKGILSMRQRLSQPIVKILGLKFPSEDCYNKMRMRSWQRNNPLSISVSEFDVEKLLSAKNIVNLFEYNKDKILKNTQQKNNTKTQECPIKLDHNQEDILLNQVANQLDQSYQAYKCDKIHQESIRLQKSDIQQLLMLSKGLNKQKQIIQQLIAELISQNQAHPDIICGYRPIISTFDFLKILTEPEMIKKFYPQISKKDQDLFYDILNIWACLTVRIDSCQRMKIHIENNLVLDKVIILRELESPRKQIETKVYWVCFEIQMKLQIWLSQYEIFQHLMGKQTLRNHSVPQLNMGEGKTQIIIPMIVLQMKFGPEVFKKKIPRINLLSAIFQQSKANYFRFFSATSFNISVVQLPFIRQVQILDKEILNSIKRTLKYFQKKMIILLDQSSTHSIILKLRQSSIKENGQFNIDKQMSIFEGLKCIDIFDQVDAQMTPKKSFVYSIGKEEPLQNLRFRCKIPQIILNATCECIQQLNKKNYLAIDETPQKALQSLKNGQYPKGMRISSNLMENQSQRSQIRLIILSKILQTIKNYQQIQFLTELTQAQIKQLQNYLLSNKQQQPNILKQKFSEAGLKIIYNIRGLLGFGIFQHCMLLRCTVNYGVPDKSRVIKTGKRLAVPYQASNVASKKNDFAQPDVALLLTYLAYFREGVQYENVIQALQKLIHITKGNQMVRNQIYKSWYNTLSIQNKKVLQIQNCGQINIDSNSQMNRFYRTFRMNRKFISFWLQYCVFPEDMGQYLQSITSSTWDHSNVEQSIGFSGTKDLHRLFPEYLKYEQSSNDRIKGTDGKMLEMLIQHTIQIKQIPEGQNSLWQKFLQTYLQLPQGYNTSCIIDVGALLAGNSLKNQIVPWLNNHKNFNRSKKFKGISYCHNNNWQVYQLSNFQSIKRGTNLPDHETFVIFDQYRTRGADMKLNNNITGVISLGPDLTKDRLMQAAGRLRKIGRNQKIIFIMTHEVREKIKMVCQYSQQMDTKQKVQAILKWSCLNSINETQKYFLQNSKLAKIHFQNKTVRPGDIPFINRTNTELENLYSRKMVQRSVHQLSIDLFKEVQNINISQKSSILKQTQKYAENYKVNSQEYNQIRQRQLQMHIQQEKIQELQFSKLQPIPENDNINPLQLRVSHLKYQFDNNLKISVNFKKCTKSAQDQTNTMQNSNFKAIQKNNDDDNQMQNCYFIWLKPSNICMITIRQANKLLKQSNLQFYDQNSITYEHIKNKYIARLSDLDINSLYIKENNLQEALVQCKFYNGNRTYNAQQRRILKNFLQIERQNEQNVFYFLRKRKLQHYYRSSTLQKLYQQISLMNRSQMIKNQ